MYCMYVLLHIGDINPPHGKQRRGELVIGLRGWNAAGPIFGTGWEIRVGTKDPELLRFSMVKGDEFMVDITNYN